MIKRRGVTLMELIVVVAIIAIMASVAYPNYTRLKMIARRADAQAADVATESMVEQYLAQNDEANLSSTDMETTEFTNYNPDSSTPVLSSAGFYVITIVPDDAGYAINATATVTGNASDCTSSTYTTFEQCADTDCRIISIYHGERESTNSAETVADEATTTCW